MPGTVRVQDAIGMPDQTGCRCYLVWLRFWIPDQLLRGYLGLLRQRLLLHASHLYLSACTLLLQRLHQVLSRLASLPWTCAPGALRLDPTRVQEALREEVRWLKNRFGGVGTSRTWEYTKPSTCKSSVNRWPCSSMSRDTASNHEGVVTNRINRVATQKGDVS